MTDQTDKPTDPLAELRDQIRATTEAAARLAEEQVPPSGWAAREDPQERQQELQALIALVEALRDLVPPELKAQVRDVLRQLLLLLRAVIDWWVERMDGPPATASGPAVQEIPID